jgi:hypothetical protein
MESVKYAVPQVVSMWYLYLRIDRNLKSQAIVLLSLITFEEQFRRKRSKQDPITNMPLNNTIKQSNECERTRFEENRGLERH